MAHNALAAAATFGNPIGYDTIAGVLGSIMNYLKGIAGTLAVLFIIIGGVMYMLSAGNKEMMERGKKTLIYAMAGAAIVIAAPTIYNEITTILGGPSSGIGGLSLAQILTNALKLLLSIAGTLAIISMVLGAIWMFTASGDKERYELGKKTVTYAIVGTIITVGSLILVQQIATLIGG
jgi:type IV secretory pathway VirB2 component (pilin)